MDRVFFCVFWRRKFFVLEKQIKTLDVPKRFDTGILASIRLHRPDGRIVCRETPWSFWSLACRRGCFEARQVISANARNYAAVLLQNLMWPIQGYFIWGNEAGNKNNQLWATPSLQGRQCFPSKQSVLLQSKRIDHRSGSEFCFCSIFLRTAPMDVTISQMDATIVTIATIFQKC